MFINTKVVSNRGDSFPPDFRPVLNPQTPACNERINLLSWVAVLLAMVVAVVMVVVVVVMAVVAVVVVVVVVVIPETDMW